MFEQSGGIHGLRSFKSAEDVPVVIAVHDEGTASNVWFARSASVVGERVDIGTTRVFVRGATTTRIDPPETVTPEPLNAPSLLPALRRSENDAVKAAVGPLNSLLDHYRVFRSYRYVTTFLRRQGSQQSADTSLHEDGANVFSVLRNWRDKVALEGRFDFVLRAMREAFPTLFHRIEFESAGSVVFAAAVPPNTERSLGAASWSEGAYVLLLHLCAVASAPKGAMISIDEPENSLHPRALRVFMEHLRARARTHDLTVALATHSPTLLNHFNHCPEQVFACDPALPKMPMALTELHDEEWLPRFQLGTLHAAEQLVPTPAPTEKT